MDTLCKDSVCAVQKIKASHQPISAQAFLRGISSYLTIKQLAATYSPYLHKLTVKTSSNSGSGHVGSSLSTEAQTFLSPATSSSSSSTVALGTSQLLMLLYNQRGDIPYPKS